MTRPCERTCPGAWRFSVDAIGDDGPRMGASAPPIHGEALARRVSQVGDMRNMFLICALAACDTSMEPEPQPDAAMPRPENRGPTAAALALETGAEVAIDFEVTASDPDGDALAFEVLRTPLHGVLHGTAPVLTFTPAPRFVGEDTIIVRVSDGHAVSDVPVTVHVRAPELATLTDGVLELNMGPRASRTQLPPEIDESFHVHVGFEVDMVVVEARGYTQTFTEPVSAINADAGEGDDQIEIVGRRWFPGPTPPEPSATLRGGPGRDTLRSAYGKDVLDGGPGDDILDGGDGDDVLRGGPGSDILRGGAGADRFELRPAELEGDEISGGVDADTVMIIGTDDGDVITMHDVPPVKPGSVLAWRFDDHDPITNAVRGSGVLELPPALERDFEVFAIDGRGGDDRISLSSDIQYGLRIFGGPGRDVLEGGSGPDELFGGPGSDTLRGNGGDDILSGGTEADTLQGGPGLDLLYQELDSPGELE